MAADQNENRRRNANAVLKAIGFALLAVVLVFAAARVIAGTAPSDLLSVLTKSSNTVTSDGYILEFEDENVQKMLPFSSGAALLGQEKMLYVQSGGNAVSITAHDYKKPQVVSCGRTMLVYDLGNTKYRIEKNSAVFSEKQASAAVLCAAVGASDNYAVATYAYEGFQSRLYVYDKDGKLMYEWGSARDFITGIALSDDGKQVAVAVAGSENADYYSKVFIFEFGLEQPLYSYTFSDVTVLAMDYMKNDTLAVVTDAFVTFIKDGMEEKELTYVAGSLVDYSVSHADALAVLIASGAEEDSELRAYSWDRGAHPVVSGLAIDSRCERISVAGKFLMAAGEKKSYQYDKNGELCGSFSGMHTIEDVLLVNQTAFCLTENGLAAFSVFNHDMTEPTSQTQE